MQGVFKITGVRSMIFDQYLELEFDMIFSVNLDTVHLCKHSNAQTNTHIRSPLH